MSKANRFAACVLLSSTLMGTALAQATWDRKLSQIEPVQGRDGSYAVRVTWSYGIDGAASETFNLGTQFDLYVNNVLVAQDTVSVFLIPPFAICGGSTSCFGSCGNSTLDGLANDLYCVDYNQPGDCYCGALWLTSDVGEGSDIQPGDEITVVIAAAPGALAELDTTYDKLFLVYVPCPGDLDGSKSVDLTDITILLSHYGMKSASFLDGDLNGDDVVDLTDLAEMLALYGTRCQ